MSHSRRSSIYLAIALALSMGFVPLGANAVLAAPHLAAAPTPESTYYTCRWNNETIQLQHVPTVAVERFHDAVQDGKCKNFRTNDHRYARLNGHNINVFVAWRQYPGLYVAHNSRQGHQPVYGSWVFPIRIPTGYVAGTVTDAATKLPLAGATVSASTCQTSPTEHCAIRTDVTNSKGAYTLQLYVQGKYSITAEASGYTTPGTTRVSISGGRHLTRNFALSTAQTSTSLTVASSPVTPAVNQGTTLTATLGASINDGTITFTGTGPNGAVFTSSMCTPTNGACSVSWTPSAAGTWSFTASYSGDAAYKAVAGTVQINVTTLSTTLTISSNPSVPTPGATATLTATLGAAINDGTVTFSGSGPNSATLPNTTCIPAAGSCTVSWTPPVAGIWTISASWSGDSQYGATSSTSTISVGSSHLTVTVGANPNPVQVGQTDTVSVQLGQNVTGGSVTFSDSGPNASDFTGATCAPINGGCLFLWEPTVAGTDVITATFGGNAQYPSSSGSTTVTVNPLTTTLTLSQNPNPLPVGQTGTLTASLSPATTGGTVTFTGSGPNGAIFPTQSCSPTNGTCSIHWQPTVVGTWNISATWTSSTQGTSAVATLNASVAGSTSTLSLSISPSTVALNQTALLTASATGGDIGTVTFSATSPPGANVSIGTCVITATACATSWRPNAVGTWSIMASLPAANGFPAAQATQQVTVASASFLAVTISPIEPSVNTAAALTAVLGAAVNDGYVTFEETPATGSPMQQTCSPQFGTCTSHWTPTTAGQWTITATWSGDGSNPLTTETFQVTVLGGITTLTLSDTPTSLTVGQTATATASISFPVNDGTVTFQYTGPSGATAPANHCVPAAGSCSQSWTPSTAGTWTISASWSGDSTLADSSTSISVVVGSGGSGSGSIIVTAPASASANQPVTVSATLPAGASGGYQISFSADDNNGDGFLFVGIACTPVNGSCGGQVTFPTPGTWTLTAYYADLTGTSTVSVST